MRSDLKTFLTWVDYMPIPIAANIDDIAEAIANPPANRPIANAIGTQGRRICDAVSNAPPWLASSLPTNKGLGLICKPYWDSQGISPPVAAPPFTGGQCPGEGYRIEFSGATARLLACSTGGTATQNLAGGLVNGGQIFTGPISGLSVVYGPQVQCGFEQAFIRVTAANGTFDFLLTQVPPGNPTKISSVSVSGLRPVKVTGPDTCGDPPIEVKPGPNPSPRNPIIPEAERPFNDPIRGPVLPIPDVPTMPGFPSQPVPTSPFGNPGPSGDPLDGGEPGQPEPTGDGGGGVPGDGEAEGEAPEGTELVGLRMDLAAPPLRPREFAEGVYRAGAYVYMGGPEGLDQDPAGASIRDGQFVYAERPGLTKWRVSANTGFNWLVTPYYRKVE